jgi:hypothetical protein
MRGSPKFFSILVAMVCAFSHTASAHREDYIDETLVFQTVEKGAIEPEYWFDYGHRGDSDTYFQRHNLAVEYGLTDHLMIDARVTVDHPENRSTNFDSGRIETRYRFGEEEPGRLMLHSPVKRICAASKAAIINTESNLA